MGALNANDRGISLSYEASLSSIHFLDLEIMVVDQHLEFKTYFKPTDRNGYIPSDSCHHAQWLQSVPRSQFLRLRRNCSKISDYYAQCRILKERFVAKGYNAGDLDVEINRVSQIDRNSTLVERPTNISDSRAKWSFFYHILYSV